MLVRRFSGWGVVPPVLGSPSWSGVGVRLSSLTTQPIVLFVGNYGSGKTEVSVNFSIAGANAGLDVRIADLDLVNPYFRCREAREALELSGVGVVLPPEEFLYADLPILSPSVKGMIQRPDGLAVLDVGGDDAGATVLASLAPAFPEGGYEMLQVVNRCRPFTDTAEGVLRILDDIERASRLHITGLVSNAHLMDETSAETIYDGYALAREVGERRGLPVRFVTAARALASTLDATRLDDVPVLPLDRLLLPPWRRSAALGSSKFRLDGRFS